nr:HAMP domain-containing sensor histidine kinase [uncultured Rhodoferax sp.]
MRLFDLSLRYKMPLWGGGLILATALALSVSFMVQAWDNLHHDLQNNAENMGRITARALFAILLHDEVWQAYEVVTLPFVTNPESARTQSMVVFDNELRVYVSSRSHEHALMQPMASLGPEFAALARELPREPDAPMYVRDAHEAQHIYVALPIASDGVRLGTLVVAYHKSVLWQRFSKLMQSAIWITLLVLGVLLPVTAYWGRRMMRPMQWITEQIRQMGDANTESIDPAFYTYQDEVGLLYQAYADMHAKLQEKAIFEKEMVKSERMAAVGRLTASIAHEINNPLGGMLNAISTLKRHGNPDPLTQKTISLLERGLSQIRDTVAALLVQAKVKSRPLSASDFEDVRVLVTPAAKKRATRMNWSVAVPDEVGLPSTLVRQVLINLLLNAIAATGQSGQVNLRTRMDEAQLVVEVENTGQPMSPDQLAHLYEPFTSFSENGNGLGLWICYQIVTQLGGTIRAESGTEFTRFTVILPTNLAHETSIEQNLPD